MELILERIAKRKTCTIGRLYIQRRMDGDNPAGTVNDYFCDTLEPTWRDYKNGTCSDVCHSMILFSPLTIYVPFCRPSRLLVLLSSFLPSRL